MTPQTPTPGQPLSEADVENVAIVMSRQQAEIVDRVFLPANPNKLRSAHPDTIAAAPAVQPAAGDEIARIVLDAVFEGFEHGECEKEWEPDYGRELAAKATSRILAALAHPPAQGSESGPTCQKCGGEIHGWCCQSCDAEFRENDAGNLVFDEDAAPVSPDSDLLKEAVGLLREYRDKTPLGHQPHMIAARADAFLSKVEERGHD